MSQNGYRFKLYIDPTATGFRYQLRDHARPKGERIAQSGYWPNVDEIIAAFKAVMSTPAAPAAPGSAPATSQQ